jgi:hypothetical protein
VVSSGDRSAPAVCLCAGCSRERAFRVGAIVSLAAG